MGSAEKKKKGSSMADTTTTAPVADGTDAPEALGAPVGADIAAPSDPTPPASTDAPLVPVVAPVAAVTGPGVDAAGAGGDGPTPTQLQAQKNAAEKAELAGTIKALTTTIDALGEARAACRAAQRDEQKVKDEKQKAVEKFDRRLIDLEMKVDTLHRQALADEEQARPLKVQLEAASKRHAAL